MSFWIDYCNMLEFHYNRKFITPICSEYDEEWDEIDIYTVFGVTFYAILITLFIAWWKVPLSILFGILAEMTTVRR